MMQFDAAAVMRNIPESASGSSVLETWLRSYAHLAEEARMLVDRIILEEPGSDSE